MLDETKVDWNIAETAYWWLHYGSYGSESKAIRALRKRKGMAHLDQETATRRLSVAARILERTEELGKSEIRKGGYKHLFELSEDEFNESTSRIQTTLDKEFPESEETVSYMIAMLWHMPYVR